MYELIDMGVINENQRQGDGGGGGERERDGVMGRGEITCTHGHHNFRRIPFRYKAFLRW